MDVLIKVTSPSRDGVSEGAEGGEGMLGEPSHGAGSREETAPHGTPAEGAGGRQVNGQRSFPSARPAEPMGQATEKEAHMARQGRPDPRWAREERFARVHTDMHACTRAHMYTDTWMHTDTRAHDTQMHMDTYAMDT